MGRLALAVAVVGEHTVAHLAVALHAVVGQSAGHIVVYIAQCLCHVAPEHHLAGQEVVVVAELVAFLDLLALAVGAGGVQVVLHGVGTLGIVAQCVGVDVVIHVGAQHVFHGLVVLAGVGAQHEADVAQQVVGELLVQA